MSGAACLGSDIVPKARHVFVINNLLSVIYIYMIFKSGNYCACNIPGTLMQTPDIAKGVAQ
jgi:hypothetical protein